MSVKSFFIPLLVLTAVFVGCKGQVKQPGSINSKLVGGPFENREFMYIGMPEKINAVDTSPGWNQQGQKLLITGTIYHLDGHTPAPGVILYYYHTDVNGVYADKPGLDRRVIRHGYIRGWVKSDSNGHYAIYTARPAPYPGRNNPAHIHPAIKEPIDLNEYYIDEFVFDDDPLLTGEKRRKLENRGGSGVLRLFKKGDLQMAEHNIILGLNIPGYPVKAATGIQSGLQIGEDQPSFRPFHAWGPDKGSQACPVCKYGRYQGILFFAGKQSALADIKKWLRFFEQQSTERGKFLKVYLICSNDGGYDKDKREQELAALGKELNLQQVALTYVPSFTDSSSDVQLSKINPMAENTLIIYRNGNIIEKFINPKPGPEMFAKLTHNLDHSKGAYFDLD